MHITLESDYALRIVDCLAREQNRLGAKIIADRAGVTLRFSLKILRKLVASGIVRSYKGAHGGYEMARTLEQTNVNEIIEAIEGPVVLNRCLYSDYVCPHTQGDYCPYHELFANISDQVQDMLKQATLSSILTVDATSGKSVK